MGISLDEIARSAKPTVGYDTDVFLDTVETVDYDVDGSTKLTLKAFNRNRSEPSAQIEYSSIIGGSKFESLLTLSENKLPAWTAVIDGDHAPDISAQWFYENVYTKVTKARPNASKSEDTVGFMQSIDVIEFVTDKFEVYLQDD